MGTISPEGATSGSSGTAGVEFSLVKEDFISFASEMGVRRVVRVGVCGKGGVTGTRGASACAGGWLIETRVMTVGGPSSGSKELVIRADGRGGVAPSASTALPALPRHKTSVKYILVLLHQQPCCDPSSLLIRTAAGSAVIGTGMIGNAFATAPRQKRQAAYSRRKRNPRRHRFRCIAFHGVCPDETHFAKPPSTSISHKSCDK